MGAVARIERSPVEAFVDLVLPADRLADLARDLPAHIRPDLFKRNLLNAVMINWDLMECEPGMLFREVSKAAGLGLYLDPALGEAYIVMAYDYKTKKKQPQLRIGYRGLTKLAKQSGSVSLVYAHEVRANDHIVCRLGTEKQLVHEPKLFTDRGDIIGYYAVITYNDEAFDFEPMSVEDIHGIRDRSDAWKAFQGNLIKSTPWSTDESEMAKKTAIRRLMKRAPQSPELVAALKIEDAAEGYVGERPQQPKRVAPAPPHTALTAVPQPEPEVEAERKDEPPRRAPAPPPRVEKQEAKPTISQIFAERAKAAKDVEELGIAWNDVVEPAYDAMDPREQDECEAINRARYSELPSEDDGQEGGEQ